MVNKKISEDLAFEILEEANKKLTKVESLDLKFNEYVKRSEDLERRDTDKINSLQNQSIQILSIFVAVVGILFGFIEFSNKLNFWEATGLLFSLAFILAGFVLLTNYLLNRKR
ncbi:MAG: hypothetical protein AABW51_03120 [Nanoarchaeota archaeon]